MSLEKIKRRQIADEREVDRENQKVAADTLLVLRSSEMYHDASAQATQSISDTGMPQNCSSPLHAQMTCLDYV